MKALVFCTVVRLCILQPAKKKMDANLMTLPDLNTWVTHVVLGIALVICYAIGNEDAELLLRSDERNHTIALQTAAPLEVPA
jgi:hypothetical protein